MRHEIARLAAECRAMRRPGRPQRPVAPDFARLPLRTRRRAGGVHSGKNPTPRNCISTGSGATNGGERGANRVELSPHRSSPMNFSVMCIPSGRTQRAPRHLGLQPLDQFADCAPHFLRKIERDEQAHGLRPPVRREKKIAPHGVERGLRGCRRIRSRSPGKRNSRSRGPRSSAMPMCTRPTGFSGVPPPGPAIPVTPTPSVAPVRLRMPSASASATSELTAPFASISSGGTPDEARLQFVAVADDAAEEIGRAARHVREPLGEHAARAAFGDGDRGAIFGEHAPTTSSSVSPCVEKRCSPSARAMRSTISSSSFSALAGSLDQMRG